MKRISGPVLLSAAALLLSLAFPVGARAAYPSYVTGEADFSEGDLETSRQEARRDAVRKGILKAIEDELGRGTTEESLGEIRARILPAADDLVQRSAVLEERRAGTALCLSVGHEIDRDKVRARLKAAGLERPAGKERILLLWTDELRSLDGEATTLDEYLAATWLDRGPIAPVVKALDDRLAANGYDVVPLAPEDRLWLSETVGTRDLDKRTLREIAARTKVSRVLFVRRVHRPQTPPPAAHLKIEHVNHIAFLVAGPDADGEPELRPVTALVTEVVGGPESTAALPVAWMDSVLEQLDRTARSADLTLTIKGIASTGELDRLWEALRKVPALREVAPRRIAAEAVVFRLRGERTPQEWAAVIGPVFPGAKVNPSKAGVEVQLAAPPAE